MIVIGKHVWKVREDFYQQDVKVGDTVSLFEGKYKILDTVFRNQYGEFILCEWISEFRDADTSSPIQKGIPAASDNPYEIIGTIHLPGYRNLLAGPGFFVKKLRTGRIVGLSFRETMSLLFKEGATNAEAVKQVTGMFHSSLINSIEGLPYFDSFYWKIPVYDENGELFAELSEAAKVEVEKAQRLIDRRMNG